MSEFHVDPERGFYGQITGYKVKEVEEPAIKPDDETTDAAYSFFAKVIKGYLIGMLVLSLLAIVVTFFIGCFTIGIAETWQRITTWATEWFNDFITTGV